MATWNKQRIPDSGGTEAAVVLEFTQGSSQGLATDVQRHEFVKSFERRLFRGWLCAVAIGSLHALSLHLAFFMFCYAIWFLIRSSTVPSFTSDNGVLFLVGLIVVEITRFAAAFFLIHFIWNPLAQAPQHINHVYKDGYYYVSGWDRIISHGVRLCFIILSLVLLKYTRTYLGYGLHGLRPSILYNSVLLNNIVAFVNLILPCLAYASLYNCLARDKHPQQSILRYFDTVLKNARTSGLVGAGDFDLFRFAYTMLGDEICRNRQLEAVAKNHKDLIRYLYYHRLGVNSLQIFMGEKDEYVQLAAVYMVGFWADSVWGVGLQESELKLPKELLRKLADKVGTGGQLGSGAIYSIGALSGMPKFRTKLLKTSNSSGQLLPDCLVDSIDVSSDCPLSILRTLVQQYEQGCSQDQKESPKIFTEEYYGELREKLTSFASATGDPVWRQSTQRTTATASDPRRKCWNCLQFTGKNRSALQFPTNLR